MKKVIYLFLTLFSTSSFAMIPLLHLELYGAIDFGDYSQNESNGRYIHDADIYGAEIGTRIGLDILAIKAGGLYSIGKYHFDSDREDTQATQNQIQGYNNNWLTTLTGVYGGFTLPMFPVRLWGEYYVKARSKATYAGPDGENPYRKDEAVEGDGFGLGIAMEEKILYLGLLFRRLEYDKFGIERGNVSAGGELTKMKVNMLSVQAGIFF